MGRQTAKHRRGFTLTELTVVFAITSVVMLAMGIVLVDSQRGWNRMYDRAYGDMVADGYVARRAFDAVVHKSSMTSECLGEGEVEVYYYDDPESSVSLDRYARFHTANAELLVDYGAMNSQGHPHGRLQRLTLAHNIEDVDFYVTGPCVHMVLRLNNGSQRLTVMTSAIRHNE